MLFTPTRGRQAVVEPLISIQLFGHKPAYPPGSLLRCDYQIDAVEAHAIQAVEASVIWYTDGKGDEDMGVHYFERRVPADAPENDLRQLRSFAVDLPNTPFSYEGEILQIRWCVRVRVFIQGGKEYREDHDFELANLEGVDMADRPSRAPGVSFEDDQPANDSDSAPIAAANNVKNHSCEA